MRTRKRSRPTYPPLSERDELQRREFHEALLDAATFEDLPGKWQVAILEAEQNRPKQRLISQRLGIAGTTLRS